VAQNTTNMATLRKHVFKNVNLDDDYDDKYDDWYAFIPLDKIIWQDASKERWLPQSWKNAINHDTPRPYMYMTSKGEQHWVGPRHPMPSSPSITNFITSIRSNINEDHYFLVFADYLEEQGNSGLAEFIRNSIAEINRYKTGKPAWDAQQLNL